MEFIQIEVKERPERGTRTSRRLRKEGTVPAVLYGLGRPNLALTIAGTELERFVRTGSRLVELKLQDKTRAAILREVQHDPVTDEVLHVDFVRVDKDAEIDDRVPLVYKGRPKGVATGGVFQAITNEISVRCRPLDLPRELVIEVTEMQLHDVIYAKDVRLPDGVRLLTPPEHLLCHVVTPKVEAPPETAAAPAEGAEPELIRKAPTAEAGEEEGKGEKGAGKAEKAEKPEKAEKKKEEKK
jgi:large subunit ribosomal protein L25